MIKFRAWLNAYLQVHGISNSEFARRIGVHPTLVSMYIKGLRKPTFSTLQAIHNETGVDMNLLFEPPTEPTINKTPPKIEPVN